MSEIALYAALAVAAFAATMLLLKSQKKGRPAAGPAPRSDPKAPPSSRPAPPSTPSGPPIPKLEYEDDDEDEPLTRVTVAPVIEEDSTDGIIDEPSVVPIMYDQDAAVDEPTQVSPFIFVSAVGQTDRGRRRKKNEDTFAVLQDENLYVVADGMGGHAGGEIASALAAAGIIDAFRNRMFDPHHHPELPARGRELVQAIQSANRKVWEAAQQDETLHDMGTTVVGARFVPHKQRLYIGHVGDSRCYRMRGNTYTQMTTDHTLEAQGVTGPFAPNLTRAVGIDPSVSVDLVIAKPRAGDRYLLCSDGLTKMLTDDVVKQTLLANPAPKTAADTLIQMANDAGGRDNITVIIVRIDQNPLMVPRASRPQ